MEAAVYRLHYLIYPRYEFASFPFFIGNNAAVQGICQLFPSLLCVHRNWFWFNTLTLRQTIPFTPKFPQRTDIRSFWIVMNASIFQDFPGYPTVFWAHSNKKEPVTEFFKLPASPLPHTVWYSCVQKNIKLAWYYSSNLPSFSLKVK